MEHKLQDNETIYKFLFGGNAIFTLQNEKSGNRFTFKVTTPKGGKAGEIFFVGLLSGPDNGADYRYVGIIPSNKRYFKTTAKSRVSSSATSVKAIDWLVKTLNSGYALPDGVNFYHEGRCARCGRRLTTPESIERGFGPECAKRG